MRFLKSLPDKLKSEVEMIVVDDVLDFAEKFTILKDLIDDPDVLLQVLHHLKTNKKKEEKNPSENDFLELVSEHKQRLMRLMITKENFDMLEKLISRESEEVQKAYGVWKNWKTEKADANVSLASGDGPTIRGSRRSLARSSSPPPSYKTESDDEEDNEEDETSSQLSEPMSQMTMIDEDMDEDEVKEDDEEETHDAPNIDPNFFKKFPDTLNILILGETGVGKSTFINGLINYLKYGTIDEAHKNQVEILIKTYFTHTDEDYNRMRIECDPTIKAECGEEANESTVAGQSSTQAPKSYVFSWGPKGSKKAIRIIDTPGVGDVRGLDQEKMNFSKILNFIADFKEIHAICILLKPNESKLTLTFRYCINELLTHLHRSASENILFCFTNARQTLYRPGDTLPTLEAHLKDLKDKRGIEIPLTSKTMFCFDNESFRFLCALREGAYFDSKDIRDFNGSWVKTVDETFRMFKRISELPAHNVSETLSVNNIRSVILALARPLAEVARNQMINVRLIEDKLREVDDYIKSGKDLEGRLYVDQVKIFAKEIDYPVTVCTAKDCVEYMRFSNNPNAAMETVYKTECHPHCYLQGVQVSICPNTDLQQCWAMANDIDHCRTCGCPWSTHMHIRYKLEKIMEKTIDPTVQESIKNKDDQMKTAKLFIEQETKRRDELQEEHDRISKSCADFAAFLRKNSIMPYNDVYKEYVEHLIKEEKDKVSQGGSENLLLQLERYRDEYDQQVKILESHGTSSSNVKTIKQIYNMVDDLKRMKNCGSILAEIQKLELLSVRDQQITKVTPVDLNSGWLGRVASGAKTVFNYATGGGNKKNNNGGRGKKK